MLDVLNWKLEKDHRHDGDVTTNLLISKLDLVVFTIM